MRHFFTLTLAVAALALGMSMATTTGVLVKLAARAMTRPALFAGSDRK